ncbi:MAG: YpdA family putative bacillithiol disulfide reductase [Balneolaceae bacterium]|nr:YpdA family putative bacillithiol disulfide reductase [Balneolaceae bacterium]MBO6545260.1 YpdA family putative bacillithiol disulfide reductase [Balneolaceae bacterium]MBO6646656.1 YpdA family putative bacillithiol disulfide reductase [Balneolaceae bacterium]
MVIIIGAGPIGLATGIQLQKKNIPFQIIERGCLVNSLYHYPTNMTFFSTSDKLEIGDVPFISHGFKPTRSEALEYYRRAAEHYKLPINLYESVTSVEGEDGNFTIKTTKAEYNAEKVVVATGFYGSANKMNVPGEDLPKVKHYYDEPHPYAWQDILVVGAGNSGVDVALECYRSGANVTMAVRYGEIKPSVKYWVKPDIENRIKFGEIDAYFNTEVKEIKEHEVVLETPEGEKIIQNDFVLAMTGYHPNYKLMEALGIELTEDEKCMPVHEEDSLETNRKGMYVAGVVCGGLDTSRLFIENSRVHADQIAEHIANSLK